MIHRLSAAAKCCTCLAVAGLAPKQSVLLLRSYYFLAFLSHLKSGADVDWFTSVLYTYL